MATERTKSRPDQVDSRESGDRTKVYNPVEETDVTAEELLKELDRAHTFSNRVGTLGEIALQIDSAQSEEKIIEILRKEIEWLIDPEFSFLAFRTESLDSYRIRTLTRMADVISLDGQHFSVKEGMPGYVIDRRAPVNLPIDSCPQRHPEIEGVLQEMGAKQLLVVPLQTSSDTIGALVIGNCRAEPFRIQEVSLVQLIALQVAIAHKNLAHFEDYKKRITQIELVNEIAAKLTITLELDQLLASAAEAIRKACSYFDVTIFMVEEDGGHLSLVAHSGNYIDFLPHGYRQSVNEGLVGWVVRKGERALVNDVGSDNRYLAHEYHKTQSELAVPIRVEGKVVGVVNVEDTKLNAFDETDAIVLETVSDQLGSVISNAQLYDQVKKTNTTLKELDQMKSDFLGIVSHDFRSPLASIILAAKAMAKRGSKLDETRQHEYLGIIIDQAEKLRQLAEDTLSIIRHESGQLSYHFELVNIERLLKDAIGLVQFSRRHTVECTVDPNVAYINGDKTKLRQLIHNLLSNAVKYSPKGGLVKVTAEPESPGKVLISVSDEGIGIPPEQFGRLFRKFSRVDTEESMDIKGSGLGLWICHEIIRGHGGTIWVESEPGSGTTFKLTLSAEQPVNHGSG